MTWFDHGRRAASVLLVVLALMAVPGLASAKFGSSRTVGLTASTAQLVAPTSVGGSYRCVPGFFTEAFEVDVTGFADSGPAGATYRYVLSRGGTPVRQASSGSRTVSLDSGRLLWDGTSTRWTLTIQATLGSWTGPVYTRTVTCGILSDDSGPL
jgi:hypothetical protein